MSSCKHSALRRPPWWREGKNEARNVLPRPAAEFRLSSNAISSSEHYGRGLTGKGSSVEKLWREFFSDPLQWFDHRPEKVNPRYPDFKNKTTHQSLWIVDRRNPPWVRAELATVPPGTLQLDSFGWTKRLEKYVANGEYKIALELFEVMQRKGMIPDRFTFVPVLKACTGLRALKVGRWVHTEITKSGCESDEFVGNSLIDMYAKCGSIEEARRVFNTMPTRCVVSWNVMISGYVKCGQVQRGLELFHQMHAEGVGPDRITFVGVLNACASVAAIDEGRAVHKQVIERGLESDIFVGSCLVDMYTKCRCIEDAWTVFRNMPTRNVVAWSAMILGYVKCGKGQKALELARQMRSEGIEPNAITFVGMLNACASVAALEEGRYAHKLIAQSDCHSNIVVNNSLIDMYAKCGSIEDARSVFNTMPARDVFSWTTMIAGYAMHGRANQALGQFNRMCQDGVETNRITFVSLLSACSHGGLIDEGLQYFDSMSSVHSVCPTGEHYACIVDLLGRAGRLHEAEDLVKTMPCKPGITLWMSLLASCKATGNVEIGERAGKRVLKLVPGISAGYVLLSNIYAAAGDWDSCVDIKQERIQRREKKTPGCTWIEVNNEIHSFAVDDFKHPRIAEIHSELKRLFEQMKTIGYVPDTRFVLLDVDEERKEYLLSHHSEKLAIAFGLLNTPPGTPLRIFQKNGVCGDCHIAMKFISKITRREIIVKVNDRFHHFEDGLCSCKDYWYSI